MNPRQQQLTPKQAAFCAEFLLDLNASAAARRAGYSARSAEQQGSRLLSNVKVAARIAELQRERTERLEIDADWVLAQLVEVAQRCLQHVTPALGRDGKQMYGGDHALYRFDAQGANRALELAGRHVSVQAWRDRIEVQGEVSLIDRIQAGRRRASREPIEDADYTELPPPAPALAAPVDPARDPFERQSHPHPFHGAQG